MSDDSPQIAIIVPDRLQGILFDLDGTLLDSDDQAVVRLAKRLHPFLGRRAPTLARWLVMKAESPGNFMIGLLDSLGLDKLLVTLVAKLRRDHGSSRTHEFQLISGVYEMLPTLHAAGYKLAIVTTRTREHIGQLFEKFPEIEPLIEVTCGLQDTFRLKPHPSPVRLAANRLKIPVDHCLLVGDTVADVKSARRAGAWTVAVLCGFGEREELEKAGAHLIVDSTADLMQILT